MYYKKVKTTEFEGMSKLRFCSNCMNKTMASKCDECTILPTNYNPDVDIIVANICVTLENNLKMRSNPDERLSADIHLRKFLEKLRMEY